MSTGAAICIGFCLLVVSLLQGCGDGDGPTARNYCWPGNCSDCRLANGTEPGPSSTRHSCHPKGTKYARRGYWEYLPANYAASSQIYPLLVAYHGSGEKGDGLAPPDRDPSLGGDLRGVPTDLGVLAYLIEHDLWPTSTSSAGDAFIILSVQFPQTSSDEYLCEDPQELKAFLAFALSEYKVDPNRVYLTGNSCGAIAAYEYLARFADDKVVAAHLPLAAVGDSASKAFQAKGCAIAIPTWAFFGSLDITAPDVELGPVESMRQCNPLVNLTIFENMGHFIWAGTNTLGQLADFRDPCPDCAAGSNLDVWAWLLEQTRS